MSDEFTKEIEKNRKALNKIKRLQEAIFYYMEGGSYSNAMLQILGETMIKEKNAKDEIEYMTEAQKKDEAD